jgi:bisphosphoglycerate-dependent phosphoglycerate mutase
MVRPKGHFGDKGAEDFIDQMYSVDGPPVKEPKHPVGHLYEKLFRVNERLWDIEDGLRACEARQDFGAEFIELARASYKTNDERSAIKRQINELLQSDMSEEKQYAKY